MKRHLVMLAGAWLVASAAAHAVDCAEAVTTLDMQACAVVQQEQVEQQLNSAYRRVLSATPETARQGSVQLHPRRSLVTRSAFG